MKLSHRLTLVFSLFGLAIAGGFQVRYSRTIRQQSYALVNDMTQGIAEAVRLIVEDHFKTGETGRLGRRLEHMVRQTGIATIVVRDRSGRRMVGRSGDVRYLSRQARPELPLDKVEDGIYDVEKRVSLGDAGKGVVQVGFHTAALEQRLREISNSAVRAGVMAFLAITLAAWLIGAWFGLRLSRLVPRIEALPRDPEGFRPIRNDDSSDEVSRLVAAFNRLGATLKEEMLRRREVEREKRELSAMLVHDLKTPLTVIHSGIALLKEQIAEGLNGKSKGKQRTFDLLEMSAHRLHRMVEDVLQLSRLEEVSGLRERVSVDMAEMLGVCAKDFELVAVERGQKIALNIPKRTEALVLGDPALLRRVLDNLAHNAVEHTPAGGAITLALSIQNNRVKISVSDSGPGVPPEARPDIFRKFFQKDMKRHVGNVGLGLALCEKAVLRHQGLIGIEDASPKGACFYFILPLAQPELLSEAVCAPPLAAVR
ncbi:MAG: hypothetical protein A3J74_09125 [Elusimicrobia bacterium RIFCSPHIGHO2_02_FULL_57_9]|nr:MAG: hypothetical protein A3J74_09125 [Elusimicrobia bacterium RIFCSPHIGHO2_02_FULL_57_9]